MWCMIEAAQLKYISHVCRTWYIAQEPGRYKDIINYEGHSITRIIFGTKMYSVMLFTLFILQLIFISFPFYVIFKTPKSPPPPVFFFLKKETLFFKELPYIPTEVKTIVNFKIWLAFDIETFFLFFSITIINVKFGVGSDFDTLRRPYVGLFYRRVFHGFITLSLLLKFSFILALILLQYNTSSNYSPSFPTLEFHQNFLDSGRNCQSLVFALSISKALAFSVGTIVNTAHPCSL